MAGISSGAADRGKEGQASRVHTATALRLSNSGYLVGPCRVISVDFSASATGTPALVAERGQSIVGALYALPPGAFIASIIDHGIEIRHALLIAVSVIKIKAVAVDSANRGQGIASALLTGCARLYDQLGYLLLYGSFAVGSGLESFYSDRGFEVLPVGESIPLDIIVGQPVHLSTLRTEQLFARWRS